MGALPLAFAQPLVLLGLLGLPVLWWLLRLVPPRPRQISFPPTRLLFEIAPKEETPSRTPWWLTLLRLTLAAIIIFAAAGPLWNPPLAASNKAAPLLIMIDDGWAAAAAWDARLRTAEETAAGPGPQPLDLSTGGPTVEAAAEVDAPAESLASAGSEIPRGVDVSNDPRLGSATAPVTVVEFSDFQCPHCATFHGEIFPALQRLYGDQVRWVFVNRFFPQHDMAERSAMAGECAARQGKFWEFAAPVFAGQAELSRGLLDDVAVDRPVTRIGVGAERIPDQGGQVVPGTDLRQTSRRPDAQLRAQRCSAGSTSRPNTSIHSRWLRPTLCR